MMCFVVLISLLASCPRALQLVDRKTAAALRPEPTLWWACVVGCGSEEEMADDGGKSVQDVVIRQQQWRGGMMHKLGDMGCLFLIGNSFELAWLYLSWPDFYTLHIMF